MKGPVTTLLQLWNRSDFVSLRLVTMPVFLHLGVLFMMHHSVLLIYKQGHSPIQQPPSMFNDNLGL